MVAATRDINGFELNIHGRRRPASLSRLRACFELRARRDAKLARPGVTPREHSPVGEYGK